jgi:hypothetical protein
MDRIWLSRCAESRSAHWSASQSRSSGNLEEQGGSPKVDDRAESALLNWRTQEAVFRLLQQGRLVGRPHAGGLGDELERLLDGGQEPVRRRVACLLTEVGIAADVRAIIRDVQERQVERERLDAFLIEGLDSGPATPLTPNHASPITPRKRITFEVTVC